MRRGRRVIFFGTPAIAVPSLDALTNVAEVSLVVCQPDKPKGRGLEMAPPPVKARALDLGIPVLQPTKVRTPEFAERIRAEQADVAVVIAYGRILVQAVLDAPRLGCVNLHASILPLYRGAAPITWALVDGQERTGVSLMQMDAGMDTGPVLATRELAVPRDWNAATLGEALGRCAAEVVAHELPRLFAGELTPTPQDASRATHARLLTKEDGRVPLVKPANAVHNHVRGMNPWPGAFATVGDKAVKLLRTRVGSTEGTADAPGTVIAAEKDRIEIACGEGTILLDEAQFQGKKALSARDLVSGRAFTRGLVLTS